MTLWQDVRFACRLLIKDRWFTLVATIALALGIGVNATVFTLVNAVLLRGLPFKDSPRIMAVWTRNTERGRDVGVSFPDYRDWRTEARSFSGLAAYTGGTMNVSDEGHTPERLIGSWITASLFEVIGQQPVIGRGFAPDDDRVGAQPVVILSHGVWKTRYGADPSVVGRTINVNDILSTVIGVMPEGMKFPNNVDIWQPLGPTIKEEKRDLRGLQVLGRLRDGASLEQSAAEMKTIAARLTRQYPDTNKSMDASVLAFNDRVNGTQIKAVFWSLMGAVAFVLLIACANVANLLLARSAQRAREIVVRVSLGATRWRIVRQLLVESVLLAIISGALGLVLAVFGVRWFDAATQDKGKPYWMVFMMDGTVFTFFALVCLGTGILFGLAPALHVSKTDVNDVLKEGGRSGTGGARARRWTSALVIVELALTIVLLTGAGLMMRSFLTLYRLDVGFKTDHLLTMRIDMPERKYPNPENRIAFEQRLADRLAAVPRVESATLASRLPLNGGARRSLNVDGRPIPAGERPPDVTVVTVGPRYFQTLNIPLWRGREFSDTDGAAGKEAAIVNQRFVTMHFRGEDPIGRRIQLREERGPEPKLLTIIGVSSTVRQAAFQEVDPDAVVYIPYRQDASRFMSLIVRSPADPTSLIATIREVVRTVDPDLPVFNVFTMDHFLAESRWPFRVFGTMFTTFALIALVLAAVGIYAVTAYSVTQRTQEIGVRMALGAQPAQVGWLILRRSMLQLAVGLVIGLSGALGVGKALESVLVQVGTRDPVTLGSIAALLIAVSLAASVWPARRATRLDPQTALRYE